MIQTPYHNYVIAYASPVTIQTAQDAPKSIIVVKGHRDIPEDKTSILAQAGVSKEDWEDADFVISKESGWNPNALNAKSGACGLMQFLPCSEKKAGKNWNDPVEAITRGNQYAVSRYGSWAKAKDFWAVNKYW